MVRSEYKMKLFILTIILLVSFLGWTFVSQMGENEKFNEWSDICVKSGGFVFQSHRGMITQQFSCHLDK